MSAATDVLTHAVPMSCSCGRRWTANSRVPLADLRKGGRKFTCPDCDKQNLYRPQVTKGRRCADCGGALNAYTPPEEDTCGPCDETRLAKMDAALQPAVEEALADERRAVLECLPGSLPVVVQVSGVRWVDCQRVIRAAVQAGDVIQWNAPGFRPIYKLVADLGEAPVKPKPRTGAKTPYRGGSVSRVSDAEILAALPATASDLTERFGYSSESTVSSRMSRMSYRGLVRHNGRVITDKGGYAIVWYCVEGASK